jgi:Secretion system C-terminal sorting domain
MKFFIRLCFFFMLPLSIQAQAVLEMTYLTTDLHRVYWTIGGEKYWYADDSLKIINIYSANHQLVKTISYPSVLNSQVRLLKSEHGVTQTTIQPDNLLEMVWFIKDNLTKKEQVKVINERDSVLFVFKSLVDTVVFSEIEGLKTKLFVVAKGNYDTTIVYGLPNIEFEKAYQNVRYLHRKKFGYAGEKYFYKDSRVKRVKIYDSTHIHWRDVKLNWFPAITMGNNDPYLDVDDNVFAKDSLVEVVFSYWSGDDPRYGIIQENNKIPLFKSSYPPRLDHQKGLKDQLFARIYQSNRDEYYRIYSLPSFSIAAHSVLPVPLDRALTKKYGEVIIRFFTNHLTLSYNNVTNAKTINFPTNIIYPQSIFPNDYSPIINDSTVNKDSLIEIVYATYDFINNNKIYTTRIINENGFIYNTIDNTQYFSINQSQNLPPKLITKTGNDKPYNTKVWRFNTTTPTKETPSVLEAKIYPNPFTQSINIEVPENTVFPLNIRVTNTLGQVVLATQTFERQTNLALPNLGKGVYFLELKDANKRVVREIAKMDF